MSLMVAALFTSNAGDPATALALAEIDIYLYERAIATGAVTTIWTAVNPTETVGNTGVYTRMYTGDNLLLNDYLAYAHYTGAVSVDSHYSLSHDLPEYAKFSIPISLLTITAAMRGEEIDILRGDTLDIDVVGLGDISTRSKLWFTVKDDKDTADEAAIIQIEETAGLLAIAGAPAATSANGSIVVTDAATGEITIELAAVETAKLVDTGKFYYDIQVLEGTAVRTLVGNRAAIIGDVTRAVS